MSLGIAPVVVKPVQGHLSTVIDSHVFVRKEVIYWGIFGYHFGFSALCMYAPKEGNRGGKEPILHCRAEE
jgi:hypothetical protein